MTKRMSSKEKWFIAIGILVCVLVSAGIYGNYRLDKIVASLNRPGVLFSLNQPNGAGDEGQGENAERQSDDEYWNKSWDNGPGGSNSSENGGNSSGNNGEGSNGTVSPPSDSQIANDVANTLGRPIDKTDMVKAGLIILKRLNSTEISYLYNIGRKGRMTADEKVQVRKILLNKLNSDDIATLKVLGKKYGRNLTVLDN